MQKWRYAEVEVRIGGPLSGTTCDLTIFRSDEKHERRSGKLGKIMADMGENGWELVASSARTETGLGGAHKINYMFKCPIDDSAKTSNPQSQKA